MSNELKEKLSDLWTEMHTVIYPRAEFRCEYCDRNMLSDFMLMCWANDHILPKKTYVSLCTEREKKNVWNNMKHTACDYRNIALSCYPCNKVKSDYDPNKDGQPIVATEATDVTLEQRDELIRRTRRHLRNELEKKNKEKKYPLARQIIAEHDPDLIAEAEAEKWFPQDE